MRGEMDTYHIAVDIGGTFTDCVTMDEDGITRIAKVPTTPGDPSNGVFDALQVAAEDLGVSVSELLKNSRTFVHGCTIATNAMLQRAGVKTGLITTKGHEETIIIGRVLQKHAGLSERELIHTSRLHKAEPPIIDRELICGVSERVDFEGDIVVPLNLKEVEEAVQALVEHDHVEAIAICLLWSPINPSHEQRIRDLIRKEHPQIYVSTSVELVPLLGEYERTVTTVLNSYLGPLMVNYVEKLEQKLRDAGFPYPLLLMQATGGLTTAADAKVKPILTLDSGPVGGTCGSASFGEQYGEGNLICTDVGGTSFDVSLIHDGQLQRENEPVIDQYTFRIPKVATRSIGAGGGSIAWLDEAGVLRVGPLSAGADPGPACYDLGGEQPTATDADLVLGLLNPEYFLGGRMPLNRTKAELALSRLAHPLGIDVVEVAAGIFTIMNAHMADLIRKCTVERGFDPRDFVLLAYGGAGPTHAAFYGADVGPKTILALADSTAFSALGMLTSQIIHSFETSAPVRSPFTADKSKRMADIFEHLRGQLADQFRREGISAEEVDFEQSAFMKYEKQAHELQIRLDDEVLERSDGGKLVQAFLEKYGDTYGSQTAYTGAGIEVTSLRIDGLHKLLTPRMAEEEERLPADPSAALKGERQAYLRKGGGFITTPTYDGAKLRYGHTLQGPAIIERMGDTVVIPAGFVAFVDPYRNIAMKCEESA